MLGDWTYHPAHDNPSVQHPNDGQIAIAARPTANVSLPFRDPTGSSSLGREKELLQASGRIGGQVGDFRPSCVSCVCHFSNHSQNPKLVSCATAKSFFAPVGALRLRILGGTGRVLPLVFAALLHCTRSGCCGLRFRLDTGAAVLVHRRLSMSNPLHHDREPRCKRTTSPEPPRTRRRTNLRLACDGCLPLPAHGRHGGLLIETFPLQTPASPYPDFFSLEDGAQHDGSRSHHSPRISQLAPSCRLHGFSLACHSKAKAAGARAASPPPPSLTPLSPDRLSHLGALKKICNQPSPGGTCRLIQQT